MVLSANSLSGTLVTQLGRLGASLSYLGLDANALSGTFSTQYIGKLHQLESLNIDSNRRISGTLPHQLSSLSRLTWLDCYKNRLSGTLAPGLFSIRGGKQQLALENLRLHANELSGTIPSQLGALKPRYCYLSNAQCLRDGAGEEICASLTTNAFACPLPKELSGSGCGGRGLNCTARTDR